MVFEGELDTFRVAAAEAPFSVKKTTVDESGGEKESEESSLSVTE